MIERLRAEPHPVRFLASRLLWRSGLCRRLTIGFPERGYRLRFHPNAVSASLWVDRDKGADDRAVLGRGLAEGELAVDVGANVGALAVEAAALVGPQGTVYAFEPNPHVFPYLEDNVALNDLKQVKCLNYAVGDSHEPVRFTADPRSDEFSRVDPEGAISVPSTTLDDAIPGDARIALLKVDVEGYEMAVFRGATRTLERTDRIFFEVADEHFERFGYTTAELLALLRESGFEIYRGGAAGTEPEPLTEHSGDWDNLIAARPGVSV